MAPRIDLIGQRFGRMVVMSLSPIRATDGKPQWLLRCDCGSDVHLATTRLRSMGQISCGCATHYKGKNTTHGLSKTPTYQAWGAMLDRCTNPKNARFNRYGGRGINVCERWRSFENFIADMGEKPAGKSLDRFPDTNGNYEPGNCRWATAVQQGRNRARTVYVEFRGERRPATEWAEILGFPRWTITCRLHQGWTPERALTQPLRQGGAS